MITQRIAQFVVGTSAEAIPEAAIGRACDALLDVIGTALAGASDKASVIARSVLPSPRPSEASIWGLGCSGSAEDAAFVNAIQAHALDFDDSSSNMRSHPSCTMLPTALAVGELMRASGRQVLASYAIGLEVARRITPALGPEHYLHGWHTTATIGIFGATAVAGRLFGLDRRQQQIAFGIAASQVGGLSRNFGTMTKPFHPGYAARAAIQSARLARAGFTADEEIFEGEQNVLSVYGSKTGAISSEAVNSLGLSWELIDPGLLVKQWPCCYATHRALAGVQQLQQELGFLLADVTRIQVGFPPGTEGPLKYHSPQTGLEGKFSIEYVLAAFLIDGGVFIDSFTDERVRRAQAQEVMKRITRYAVPSDRIFSSLSGFTDLIVTLGDRKIERRIDRTPGSSEWPLSAAAQTEKFLNCARLAMPVAESEELASAIRAVPGMADIRELFALRTIRA